MIVFANIGASSLYLLFLWLVSASAAAWLADRKGYTERVGLMFGLILSVVGLAIVLLLPGRPGSVWKLEGPFPNRAAGRPLGEPFQGLSPEIVPGAANAPAGSAPAASPPGSAPAASPPAGSAAAESSESPPAESAESPPAGSEDTQPD
jgi:hypothetical protein